MTKKLLTVIEAAKLIGESRTIIYYFINRGLPSYKLDKVYTYGKTGTQHTVKDVVHVDEEELMDFKPGIRKWRSKPSKNKS